MRFFSGKGDSQLLKNTPSGEVNMEAIQTRKERIYGLEVVLNRDATSGGGAPNREVQLALPPIERSDFPGLPSLVCHSDIPGEWGVLVLGEDVLERGLKVTSPVINYNLLAGLIRLLFEMEPRPICCRAFERVGPLVHALGHYVRHTHRHSKWGTGLSCICSRHCLWGLEVALCELTYYHRWLNMGAELLNNKVSDGGTVLDIPDGYSNVCELDEAAFRPLGAELSLHDPIGRLQLSAKKRLVLNGGLAKLLGFSRETFGPGQSHIADEPHRLAIHREICVHLAEVSTSENIHNGRPSTLLKSVPVENERCGGGRTETFPVLQYKRLAWGLFPSWRSRY